MADVASPEGDSELVAAAAAATPEGCRASLVTETGDANGGEEDMAAAANRVVDDKVSIHEILEGMTNEFNKGVNPVNPKNNDSDKLETEEVTVPLPPKVIDEAFKEETELDGVSEEAVEDTEDTVTSHQTPEENHNGEEESSVGKQEAVKKDNSKARIVLTFRTIDENTDHGKKTKISSCSSNLTLSDELTCNDIDGVLVKIENSDENSDVVEESQAEESQAEESQAEESQVEESRLQKSQAEETKKKESTKVTEPKTTNEDKEETAEEKRNSNTQSPIQKKLETTENDEHVENSNDKAMFAEDTAQRETTAPVTRKRRIGRPRLRALRFLLFFSCYFY